MGSALDETGRLPEEGPLHVVRIARFALGRFDVTRAQWAAFVADSSWRPEGGCEWAGWSRAETAKGAWNALGFAQEDSHPVVCVGWHDAQAYIAWLSRRTGHVYRLPSEAEWEYAARAHSRSAYPWGATATHDRANYGADTCCSSAVDGRDRWMFTSPVGSFAPNSFGLFDMHGNVWQWVQDCFSASYDGASVDGSANQTADCEQRVLRGGTWGDPPEFIRSANRNWAPPPNWNPQWEYRSGGVGFRVAMDLHAARAGGASVPRRQPMPAHGDRSAEPG
jgi:formylglycine-generating enzyme required for sulfatase activity